jgi:DNA-directed RNA polymerase specialized sigma24 family protein
VAADSQRSLEAVWRAEAPRLVGELTRLVRDRGLAEELAQDALVAALEQWPRTGVPENPGASLMATAKHRAIDLLRRGSLLAGKSITLAQDLGLAPRPQGQVPLNCLVLFMANAASEAGTLPRSESGARWARSSRRWRRPGC